MTNFVEANYAQTGKSLETDEMGMREMQGSAERNAKYLLLKAPPASEIKSFNVLGLDKLFNQKIKKVIAVPKNQ